MADFKNLIDTITKAINSFEKVIPGIQKGMLDEVLSLTKQLNVNGDRIKVQVGNIRLLDRIKSKLQKIILSPEYVQAVKDYVSSFNDVANLQHQYFSSIESSFSPLKISKEIKKQAIESVVKNLTESGLSANITDKVYDLLRTSITSGGSYAGLSDQLRNFIMNSDSGEGQLLKYTKQITTDALNQFSGQYAQIISSDLGYEWFRYSGSNIETTRPWCLACRERKWFHISEIPIVIKGDFEEFKEFDGKIYQKTGLPAGMIPGTDVSNFMVYRGGYNCGHQWRPGKEELVPEDVKQRVYATPEYQLWARVNGKKVKEPVNPAPATSPAVNPTPKNNELISFPDKPITSIKDVEQLLRNNESIVGKWFNNTRFKTLDITKQSGLNGHTDMNGNISLSINKAEALSTAIENMRASKELTLDQEKAIATLWHEIWHNTNKATYTILTRGQRQYMELGNEFVARKTLPDFYKEFGKKLKNTSLQEDRSDTGYNTWVRNYDRLISHFGADKAKVLSYMKDKMTNGEYEEIKDYLVDAIVKSGNSKLKIADVKKGVTDAIRTSESTFSEQYK